MLLDRVRGRPCDPCGDHPDRHGGSSCRWPRGWLVTILPVIALAAILPLALASPPDPVWVAGVSDATDDDVVVLLSQQCPVERGPLPIGLNSIIAPLPFSTRRLTRSDTDLCRVLPRPPPRI